MRLLYIDDNGGLRWTKDYINNKEIPPYAILSHIWEDGQEVTFDDLKKVVNVKGGDTESKIGYRKIRFCGQQAKRDNLRYFWVDTCCIDKSNNTELTEAINSMFRWYQNAERCYVYLPDVESEPEDEDEGDKSSQRWISAFEKSRWFTRGWTLQELLAPVSVEFFSKSEQRLGDKKSLEHTVHKITGIPINALPGSRLSDFSITERGSWATSRRTTREEDGAYCLLGIFGVYLSLIYGEGRERALKRLMREVQGSLEDVCSFEDSNDTQSSGESQQNWLTKMCTWLSAPDPSTNYHKAHGQRQDETGLWLLESERFTAWKVDAASHLWLHGIPGCGKTILSSTIIENLLQHCGGDCRMVTVYFYFDFKDTQKQDPELMLRSLLDQLLQCSVMIPRGLEALFSSCGRGQRKPSLHAILDVIRQTMQDFTQVYIVFDALDECTQRSELLDILETVARWQLPNLHLLVTSRKERDIEKALETYVDEEHTVCLESHLVDEDIQRYVRQRLSNDRSLVKWEMNTVVREEIEVALMRGARGMYAYPPLRLCRSRI
jgi:hypothetical protein